MHVVKSEVYKGLVLYVPEEDAEQKAAKGARMRAAESEERKPTLADKITPDMVGTVKRLKL